MDRARRLALSARGNDMANFFDQFDTPAAAPAAADIPSPGPAQAGGNFFDQFDGPDLTEPGGMDAAFSQFQQLAAPAKPKGEGAGIVTNLGTGFNDALYKTAGAIVDLPVGAYNRGTRAINAVAGTDIPQSEASASRSMAKVADYYLGIPNPERIEANSPGEKIARGIGEGVGYTVAPELALRGAFEAVGAKVPALAEAIVGRSTSAPDAAANSLIGGLSGGTGTLSGEIAPDNLKPYATMLGGLGGAGVAAAAVSVPRIAREGGRMVSDYTAPLTEAGQQRLAAARLREAADDPSLVQETLERGAQELVPGSKPTTFQATGDMGLGSLERDVRNRNGAAFQQRAAEQNSARTAALEGIQPEGNPSDVVSALRQNLDDIDRSTGEAFDAATTTARQQTAALGGAGTPEGYGAAIRKQIDDADTAARARESALWNAIDPDGSLALPADDIGGAAKSIVQSTPRMAQPMEGAEAAIFQDAASLQGVQPFREVAALRSRVSTAMRQELSQNGRTQVYARLSQLRGAIERNIENAVEARSAQEAQAVASGAMREEDTIAAMIARMREEQQGWYDRRAATEAMGQSASGGAGANAAGRPGGISSVPGAEIPGGRGFRGAEGNPGIQSPGGLTPNFDEDALARLRAANEATKQRARTFDDGPVGDVLARSGSDGPFNLPAVAVPEKFFRRGPMGAEGMRALQQAAGTPQAMATMLDYAVMTLRRAAEKGDGTLDPGKVDAWRRAHADALRALPQIDQMLASPVQAAHLMERLGVARKQALDEYQSRTVGQLLGINGAPSDVTRAIGGVFSSRNPATVMRQLANEVKGNPDAMVGLRKAIADHILQRFKSTTEAATSGQEVLRASDLQNFMRTAEPALREVFTEAEVEAMKAVASDIMRANRSRDAVRLPGQSNTPQDLLARESYNHEPSWLHRLLGAAGPAIGATAATGSAGVGLGAGIVGNAVVAARKAGLEKVDDIISDAMLNPERAALLLAKPRSEREALDIARRLNESYTRAGKVPLIQAAPQAQPEPKRQPLQVTVNRPTPPAPATPQGRLTQALMSGPAAAPDLTPTQQRLVEALAR